MPVHAGKFKKNYSPEILFELLLLKQLLTRMKEMKQN